MKATVPWNRRLRIKMDAALNLPFSEWTTVFPNARLCKALLDRVTDRAHIIETGTESYRFRRTWRKRKSRRFNRLLSKHLSLSAPKHLQMTGGGKHEKHNTCFPPFPATLGNPEEFPHSHSADCFVISFRKRRHRRGQHWLAGWGRISLTLPAELIGCWRGIPVEQQIH
jgi:hypothetical protein